MNICRWSMNTVHLCLPELEEEETKTLGMSGAWKQTAPIPEFGWKPSGISNVSEIWFPSSTLTNILIPRLMALFTIIIIIIILERGCTGSLLLDVGFSPVAASWGYSSLQCEGFSRRWLLLWHMLALEHRLSNWGTKA